MKQWSFHVGDKSVGVGELTPEQAKDVRECLFRGEGTMEFSHGKRTIFVNFKHVMVAVQDEVEPKAEEVPVTVEGTGS